MNGIMNAHEPVNAKLQYTIKFSLICLDLHTIIDAELALHESEIENAAKPKMNQADAALISGPPTNPCQSFLPTIPFGAELFGGSNKLDLSMRIPVVYRISSFSWMLICLTRRVMTVVIPESIRNHGLK